MFLFNFALVTTFSPFLISNNIISEMPFYIHFPLIILICLSICIIGIATRNTKAKFQTTILVKKMSLDLLEYLFSLFPTIAIILAYLNISGYKIDLTPFIIPTSIAIWLIINKLNPIRT